MTTTIFLLAQAQQTAAQPGGSGLLVWGIVLIGLAVALFMIEMFIPSGGLIGIGAAVSLIAGIVMLFGVSTTLGLITTLVTLVILPFAAAGALKIWPDTPVGRLMMLGSSEAEDPADRAEQARQAQEHEVQVGDRGKAVTELHPGGVCLIRGQRHQCISDRGMVEAGVTVRVTEVTGFGPRVRAEED